jgi:hypothetical protein
MERGDLTRLFDAGWSHMHYGRHPVGLRNDEDALVRALFEPIWSIIVLPLFFMSTVVWDFARLLM